MSGHTVGGDYRETEKLNAGNINATLTTLSHHWRDFLKSPRGTVIRIEVLVVVTSIALLLAIFGSLRRRSRSWLIQKGVLGAFTLSSSLVIYTLGSMQSSAVKSSMYPLWAISLYILLGCADSITAYSLHDNDQTWRRMFQYILGYLYVLLISVTFASGHGFLPVVVLVIIAVFKLGHRLTAPGLASSSWNLNKMVADYMYREHTETNGGTRPYDPASMEGYRYLVDWPLNMSKLDAGTSYAAELTADIDDAQFINIEKVWLSKDGSLSRELKDACLSFSLFHLLRRCFFGFDCAESTLPKTRDFVFKGLLLFKKDEDEDTATDKCDYDRVFKVIEVELAFMYDFFFTKYAVLYYGSSAGVFLSLASASLLISLAVLYLTATRAVTVPAILVGSEAVVINENTTADVVITLLILTSAALIELMQLLFYWASIWGSVYFVCQHIRLRHTQTSNGSSSRGGSWCNRMMRFRECLAKIGVCCVSNKHYWQHKLGQYSLLESVSCKKPPNQTSKFLNFILLAGRLMFLLDFVIFHPRNYSARRAHGKLGKPIGLSEDVKGALVESLKRTGSKGKLTNGESSLESNGVDRDLISWACKQDMVSSADTSCSRRKENEAGLILTWHIATCYCEMIPPCPNEGTDLKLHIEVATTLSKYCAYLVVSEPELLPGQPYDTARVFDAVAEEAEHFLEGERDKYEAMKNKTPTEPTTTKTIFWRGVELGKQLEEMEEGRRWKVLAEFWAELMLYVAPSDNVEYHIQCLARGGELVTHLWALLSHAGILKREEEEHHFEDIIVEYIGSV